MYPVCPSKVGLVILFRATVFPVTSYFPFQTASSRLLRLETEQVPSSSNRRPASSASLSFAAQLPMSLLSSAGLGGQFQLCPEVADLLLQVRHPLLQLLDPVIFLRRLGRQRCRDTQTRTPTAVTGRRRAILSSDCGERLPPLLWPNDPAHLPGPALQSRSA